jgi:hypothetical protein
LNAMWANEEFGPALAQMRHYKAAGEGGVVAGFMKMGGKEVCECMLLGATKCGVETGVLPCAMDTSDGVANIQGRCT